MPILLLFITVPLLELWLLTRFADSIGWLTTIGLVLATAMLGVRLLKQQSSATITRAQMKLQQGSMPAEEMLEGLVLAVSGALLLTPGFITDFVGFTLLIRPVRNYFSRAIIHYGTERFFTKLFGSKAYIYSVRTQENRSHGETIEGEVTASSYRDKSNTGHSDTSNIEAKTTSSHDKASSQRISSNPSPNRKADEQKP